MHIKKIYIKNSRLLSLIHDLKILKKIEKLSSQTRWTCWIHDSRYDTKIT